MISTRRLPEEIRKREEILKAGGSYQDRPEQHPEALRDVLHMVVEKYHVDIPIYITENGLPQEDGPMEEVLNDQERIDYVRQVLIALYGALEDGIDVRGYYMWSLLDNFEWSAGFSPRYGLCYTNYETGERIVCIVVVFSDDIEGIHNTVSTDLKKEKPPRTCVKTCFRGAFLPFLQGFGNLTKDFLAGQGDASQAIRTYV